MTKTDELATEVKSKKVAEADPWKKMVTIRLPKAPQGEENFIIASVNGKVFKIMKGVEVDVPEPIYDVIQNSMDAEAEADAFIEGKTN